MQMRSSNSIIFPSGWDGRDSFGQLLANGVYLYVVEAKYDITLNPAQAIEKLVIAR